MACPFITPPTSGVVELDEDDELAGFCVRDDEDAAAAVAEDVVDIVVKGMLSLDHTGIQVAVIASVPVVENGGTAAPVEDMVEVINERDPILDGASSEVDG